MDKTKPLIVSPKLNKPVMNITLFINNFLIKVVNSFKYLEVILKNILSFNDHTAHVENKIARSIGIISKLYHYVPSEILMKLYYILIHPHLLYRILVWGQLLKLIQKKSSYLKIKLLN